jgi:transposase
VSYEGTNIRRTGCTQKFGCGDRSECAGKQVRQSSFGHTGKELKNFLSKLPKPTRVVLEACAVWERYCEAAISTGAEVVLSHPLETRLIAGASIKTDKLDSAALATLLRLDSIPLAYVPSLEARGLRRLFREHDFYTRTKTSVIRRAYARHATVGIDYSKGALQHRTKRAQFRRRHIVEVDRALDALEDLERHCKKLDQQIHCAFAGSEEAQLLSTIPGIGEMAAVALAGFLCPIERFSNVDKLTSYVGLCPTTHQSTDIQYPGRLKPDCNRSLRSLLVTASWRNRIHEPRGELAKYTRRIIRRKGKMRGSVAGAHKLLRIVYAILKQRRPYLSHAPERSCSEQRMQVPRKWIAAQQRLRRASLGPLTTYRRARAHLGSTRSNPVAAMRLFS